MDGQATEGVCCDSRGATLILALQVSDVSMVHGYQRG
jgi:hypothetical protein